MSVFTDISINGNPLPPPSDVKVKAFYLGGRQVLADGTVVIDLSSNTLRHNFEITWQLVSTEAALFPNIKIAFQDLKTLPQAYIDIDGTLYQCTIDPQQPDLRYARITVGTLKTIYWKDIKMNLREA